MSWQKKQHSTCALVFGLLRYIQAILSLPTSLRELGVSVEKGFTVRAWACEVSDWIHWSEISKYNMNKALLITGKPLKVLANA